MTQEDLDAIAKRLDVARKLNKGKDGCENNLWQFYEHDVSALLAKVKRLNLEYDAVVAAFSKYAYDSRTWYLCEWCKHKDCFDPESDENHKPPCDECRREMCENGYAPSWEWCGMKEADSD